MARWLKPFTAILLILYTVIQILSFEAKENKAPSLLDRVIIFLAVPLQNVFWTTLESSSGVWNHYIALVHTSQENDRLLKERDELNRKLSQSKEIELENERLRSLLELRAREKLNTVAAVRIASGLSSYEPTLRIMRGTKDGISPGQAVLHSKGIVGQVIQSTENMADVLLLVDMRSYIDGIVQRSRARGILKGNGVQELKFEYLSPKEDVKVGDEIVSSGLDGVYPKGISVGTVTHVEPQGKGLFATARVKPSVDFSRLEEMEVVLGEAK